MNDILQCVSEFLDYKDVYSLMLTKNFNMFDIFRKSCIRYMKHPELFYMDANNIINSIHPKQFVNIPHMDIIKKGYIDILKYIYDNNFNTSDNENMDSAIGFGKLDIMKYLNSIGIKYTTDDLDKAVICNNLEIVKYLHSVGVKCSPDSMGEAAINNNLEMAKYLHSIGGYCTTDYMDEVATDGMLEMVKYLHSVQQYHKGKSTYFSGVGMAGAAQNGHLNTVKFLHSIDTNCPEIVMYNASYAGHLWIVEFLYSIGAKYNKETILNTCYDGYLDITMLLLSSYKSDICIYNLVGNVIYYLYETKEDYEMVDFLISADDRFKQYLDQYFKN